jgi:hypothetical protein
MALSGRLLRHGVSFCEEERICLAMYMRDNLHHRLQVNAPSWMNVDYYEQ